LADTRTLHGFHAVTARLRQRPESVRAIYVDASRHDARARELAARAAASDVAVHPVDAARLQSLTGHERHQGVVAIVDAAMPHVTLDDVLETAAEPPLLLILDGVTDPHNLGACLRSADAFGAHAVVVPKDRAVGLNATVAKAASGALETVPWVRVVNLARALEEMAEAGFWRVGLAGEADMVLDEALGPARLALVLGAEGEGMRQNTAAHCDALARLPISARIESLNVSNAAAIALYAARTRSGRSGR